MGPRKLARSQTFSHCAALTADGSPTRNHQHNAGPPPFSSTKDLAVTFEYFHSVVYVSPGARSSKPRATENNVIVGGDCLSPASRLGPCLAAKTAPSDLPELVGHTA